jgi:hypothetical protein
MSAERQYSDDFGAAMYKLARNFRIQGLAVEMLNDWWARILPRGGAYAAELAVEACLEDRELRTFPTWAQFARHIPRMQTADPAVRFWWENSGKCGGDPTRIAKADREAIAGYVLDMNGSPSLATLLDPNAVASHARAKAESKQHLADLKQQGLFEPEEPAGNARRFAR